MLIALAAPAPTLAIDLAWPGDRTTPAVRRLVDVADRLAQARLAARLLIVTSNGGRRHGRQREHRHDADAPRQRRAPCRGRGTARGGRAKARHRPRCSRAGTWRRAATNPASRRSPRMPRTRARAAMATVTRGEGTSPGPRKGTATSEGLIAVLAVGTVLALTFGLVASVMAGDGDRSADRATGPVETVTIELGDLRIVVARQARRGGGCSCGRCCVGVVRSWRATSWPLRRPSAIPM